MLRLPDRDITFPALCAEAVTRVLRGPPVRVGDLPGLDDDHDRLVVARRLLKEAVAVPARHNSAEVSGLRATGKPLLTRSCCRGCQRHLSACLGGVMQVPAPFEYERATSVDHAIGLLERLGSTARLVAGGHSLLPMMKLRLANLEYLIDINDLHDELGYIRVEPDADPDRRDDPAPRAAGVRRCWPASFPIFRDAERVIADPVVRNRGTLGGSLCQADPSEDLSAVCTTLDASCVIRGPAGERVVTMEEFHRGPYETAVGRRRDAHRGPHPGAAATAAAPTRRSSGGPATGRSSRPAPRSGWTDGAIADARSGWPRSGRTPPASRRSPRRCAGRRPSRSCSPRPARLAAAGCDPVDRPARHAPTTSGTSPTSSPGGPCAAPSPRVAGPES